MDAKSAAVTNSVKNLLPPAPIEGKNKKQPKGKKHGVLYRAARKLNPDSKFRLFLKRIYYAFKKDCGPVPNAYWTIDSDIHMHNLITKRKIKKALLLNLFDNEMKKMRAFKNIHKGERCFIACTGPSLLISDLDKLKNEITFGVNSIVRAYEKTDWRPTYYVLVDNYAFGNYLKTTPIKGVALSKEASFLHYRTKLLQPVGNEVYLPIDYHNHTKENMQKEKIKYSSDPSVCVYDGFTVTNMAIQIAIYMGFKDIYIIGADCNYDPKQMHFIETAEIDDKQRNAKYLPNAVLLSIKGYEAMKKFAKKHKVNIYNATRGGKLEVFKRVNLDDMELKNQ